jgi:hypothetical protein
MQSAIASFSAEQKQLWTRVEQLWAMAKNRAEREIRSALHPDYVGWDMNTSLPHNRESAVRSVSGAAAELVEYELHPLSVRIYEGHVGVVHYSYSAMVSPKSGPSTGITGKWSEVYVRQAGVWTMISVSGRPDPPREHER